MIRLAGLLFVLLAGFSGIALADQAGAGEEEAPVVRAQNAGSVEGRVLTIDRARGAMTLGTPRARYDVVILPSTTIRGDEGFDTIADIRRGERVEVFMSRRGTIYYAQIIRLHGDR